MSEARAQARVYCRVYAPELRAWSAGTPADLTGRPAQAVTDRARAAFPDDDEEELEYAALWSAVEAAGVGQDPAAGLVCAAFDVPAQWLAPSGGQDPDRGFEVALLRPVPPARLVALHVLPAGADADDELSWYDAAELDTLADPA
ncbi:hypothetical protein BJY21_003787 [Kineosphaera limosa]|uniref:Uncharacterized protein n=1 Tax=Kineosphaera limosa NBRC 100340 TaxID=1184609 RepID=K6WTM2_9MICO|nr:hypothetical protein [Kineosphaera limosa]NYE02603.1 hypothetical protein [Kineosphaera limosa]GAB97201.1 hypothetical protein KILIM_059_00200 [Kineosphaera limosa NBRC 100340]